MMNKRSRYLNTYILILFFLSFSTILVLQFYVVIIRGFFNNDHRIFSSSGTDANKKYSPMSLSKKVKCKHVNCDHRNVCDGIWHAKEIEKKKSFHLENAFDKISLVVSHCLHDVTWLNEFILDARSLIKEIVIVSKCGKPVEGAPPNTKIINLPNVGRCDHSYLHYICNAYNSSDFSNEVIVFLKDNHDKSNLYQKGSFISLQHILHSVRTKGFGCGVRPREHESSYHDKNWLKKFHLTKYDLNENRYRDVGLATDQIFPSNYSDLGDYMKKLNFSFPKSLLIEVCYGGHFGVSRKAIQKHPLRLWQALEQSLSRGNNIEEGHFAERSWAGLLSKPLRPSQTFCLMQHSNYISKLTVGNCGMLMRNKGGTSGSPRD